MSSVPNNVVVQQSSPNNVLVTQDSPNWVNVQQDTPAQVLISEEAPTQVIVRTGGIQANATLRFVFSQATPADEWIINHNLGGKPSVTVVDSADTVVFGEVSYNGTTQVTVNFTAPFSGNAYLT